MAKQVEGVYEKILLCAKEEFLEKGFMEASLRVIAERAGTSTGSIYTRFKDKEGVFAALVSPVVEEMKNWTRMTQEVFHQKDSIAQQQILDQYTEESIDQMVDYIYSHFDIFKLLLECAYGTIFADFLNELVEMEVSYTIKYFESVGSDAFSSGRVTAEFLHIVNSGFYMGMFEIVRHHINREEGLKYVRQLRAFHYAGFKTLLEGKLS